MPQFNCFDIIFGGREEDRGTFYVIGIAGYGLENGFRFGLLHHRQPNHNSVSVSPPLVGPIGQSDSFTNAQYMYLKNGKT